MAVLTHEQWLVHKQRIRRFDRLERENKRLQTEMERLRRVAEEAEADVSAQDKRWRIGLKGEAERNGAIERLRSALAEWRRVRGE